jgi:hypothetical protein
MALALAHPLRPTTALTPLQQQLRQAIQLAQAALHELNAHQNDELGPVERLRSELSADLSEHQRKRTDVLARTSSAPEKKPSRADLDQLSELNASITLTESRLEGANVRLNAVNDHHQTLVDRHRNLKQSRDVLVEQCGWEDFKEWARGRQLELQREYVALEHVIAGARKFVYDTKPADSNTKSLVFNESSSWLLWECPPIPLVSEESASEYGRYLERKRSNALATFR